MKAEQISSACWTHKGHPISSGRLFGILRIEMTRKQDEFGEFYNQGPPLSPGNVQMVVAHVVKPAPGIYIALGDVQLTI